MMNRTRYRAKVGKVSFTYNAVPWLMIGIGIFMLATDWQDFQSFIQEVSTWQR